MKPASLMCQGSIPCRSFEFLLARSGQTRYGPSVLGAVDNLSLWKFLKSNLIMQWASWNEWVTLVIILICNTFSIFCFFRAIASLNAILSNSSDILLVMDFSWTLMEKCPWGSTKNHLVNGCFFTVHKTHYHITTFLIF